ncbi:MAG: DNA alkylation repair protein [Clostridiales bacterium]|nr:DNA alkylation repair protein [Clostridiales bacterium]
MFVEIIQQRNSSCNSFSISVKAIWDVYLFWLERYVRGWGDCDDFCTHAFGELIRQYTELSRKTVLWAQRDEFWMRRASAVVLIPSIRHDKYMETKPLQVADILMQDEHGFSSQRIRMDTLNLIGQRTGACF